MTNHIQDLWQQTDKTLQMDVTLRTDTLAARNCYSECWFSIRTPPQRRGRRHRALAHSIYMFLFVYMGIFHLYIFFWLVVSTLLKNMKVSWDYYSQYLEKYKNVFQTTNQIYKW